jgi:NTE family protein
VKSFALALGAGGARGLAHVAVFEALDEMGVRPAAIAGSSIGAVAGALYATGMTGRAIHRHVIDLAHDRGESWRRVLAARAGTFGDLFGGDPIAAMRLDAEKITEQFLPEAVPEEFAALGIPLIVVASDMHARCEVALTRGALRTALAASIALPTLMRPVLIGGRVMIDGGATNPLPFDLLRGSADVIVAVDISGPVAQERTDIPSAIESVYTAVLVMMSAIVNEKLRHDAPDLLVRPNVGVFHALDFFQASAILRIAEAVKAQIKASLTGLLAD